MSSKIKKYIVSPWKLFRPLGDRGLFNWMSDKMYLKILYRTELGKKLDLKNPKTFTEKLQWLKLYYRKDEFAYRVDKYKVREYITEKLGEEYLIPLIGVYDSVDEINWDELPEKFVLKCTHGSHCNIVCKDKNKLDIEKSKTKLNKWMEKSWFWFGREWPYKNVKPRIICEEFMVDETLNDLPDYKYFCFNGEPKLVLFCQMRDEEGVAQVDFYDNDWNMTSIIDKEDLINHSPVKRPEQHEKMLELSKLLSKDDPFVRVDFYNINGKIYFGEITYYPWCGIKKLEMDEMLGSWIELPKMEVK